MLNAFKLKAALIAATALAALASPADAQGVVTVKDMSLGLA